MELTLLPTLGPAPAPTESSTAPDPANPETAAAFAALLAGLVAPPAPTVADPLPPASPEAAQPPVGQPAAVPTTTEGAAPVTTPLATWASGLPETATATPGFASPADPTPSEDATRASELPETATATPRFASPADPTPSEDATRASGLPETATATPRFASPGVAGDAATGADRAAATAHDAPELALPDGPVARGRELAPEPAATPVASPIGIVPTTTVAATEAATAPAPTAVPVEQAVIDQLVDHLGELTARRAGGDHDITVQLDPADLGRMELRIHLSDDLVHVHLGAQERGTAELVRQHLPELRAALESAGLATGGLDVGDHPGHRQPTGDDLPERVVVDHRPAAAPAGAVAPTLAGSSTTALDLLL